VKDFVTPVTVFREDALADANVRELKRGDIIQFERRGYFIFDGVVENKDAGPDGHKTWEFIRIPDGRAAGLASKAGGPAEQTKEESGNGTSKAKKSATVTKENSSEATPSAASIVDGVDTHGVTPPDTKMYKVDMVVGTEDPDTSDATKMYKVDSVYKI